MNLFNISDYCGIPVVYLIAVGIFLLAYMTYVVFNLCKAFFVLALFIRSIFGKTKCHFFEAEDLSDYQ